MGKKNRGPEGLVFFWRGSRLVLVFVDVVAGAHQREHIRAFVVNTNWGLWGVEKARKCGVDLECFECTEAVSPLAGIGWAELSHVHANEEGDDGDEDVVALELVGGHVRHCKGVCLLEADLQFFHLKLISNFKKSPL